MFSAISAERVDIVDRLLKYEVTNGNMLSPSEKTALYTALRLSNYKAVNTLLKRKETDVNLTEPTNQDKALSMALKLGISDAVEVIIQHESFVPSA